MVENYPRLTPATIVKTLNENPEIYLTEGAFYEEHPVHFQGRKHDIQLSPVGLLYAAEKGVHAASKRSNLDTVVLFPFIERELGIPRDYLYGLVDGFSGRDPQIAFLSTLHYHAGHADGSVARSLVDGEDLPTVELHGPLPTIEYDGVAQ